LWQDNDIDKSGKYTGAGGTEGVTIDMDEEIRKCILGKVKSMALRDAKGNALIRRDQKIIDTIIFLRGTIAADRGIWTILLMWCPGVSALMTCYLFKAPNTNLGLKKWSWSGVALGYLIPLIYSTITYLIIWFALLGELWYFLNFNPSNILLGWIVIFYSLANAILQTTIIYGKIVHITQSPYVKVTTIDANTIIGFIIAKESDYYHGFLELLEQLTSVDADEISYEHFVKQMKSINSHVVVIQNDNGDGRIIGTAAILIEKNLSIN
jgi:hypothetical protein